MTQTPTPEQLQAALGDIKYIKEEILPTGYAQSVETIQFALRFTAKALGEPSEDAVYSVKIPYTSTTSDLVKSIYKDVRDAIAKECAE